MIRAALPLAAIALLSACGTAATTERPRSTTAAGARTAPTTRVRQPTRRPAQAAVIQQLPGLEGVIGSSVNQLIGQFGPARLDEWEGDARKLQFAGTACVLDVYLYPVSGAREPTATYVDARRPSDGRDVDRAACVAALRQRP
ncbi:hypothetical protein ACOYW6_11240 [Parablastomonas sp. CN1-191]|uniref:hypothetical protein n=1 Tax=Parablastomonas sp. CN1-191 TaxID=3400908 RepID=UPI003BF88C1A